MRLDELYDRPLPYKLRVDSSYSKIFTFDMGVHHFEVLVYFMDNSDECTFDFSASKGKDLPQYHDILNTLGHKSISVMSTIIAILKETLTTWTPDKIIFDAYGKRSLIYQKLLTKYRLELLSLGYEIIIDESTDFQIVVSLIKI